MKPATRRALRRWLSLAFLFFALAVLGANRWIINSTDAYMYHEASLLPENEVGLVLGTSPYREDGSPSPYFYGRIRAAARAVEDASRHGPVLICCALGFQRSAAVAACWLIRAGHAANAAIAGERIKAAGRPVHLRPEIFAAIDEAAR